MQVHVSGIHVDVGEAFRKHAEEALDTLNKRHDIDPIEATVQLSKDRFQFRIDIASHLGRGVMLRSHAVGQDAHTCLDNAINHLSDRLFRHKKRLDAHHKHHGTRRQKIVPYYVVTPEELGPEVETAEDQASKAPPIIAETQAKIENLTVVDAIMRLDLSQEPALLFRNEAQGRLNLVYRRSDGNIGWIDPQEQ